MSRVPVNVTLCSALESEDREEDKGWGGQRIAGGGRGAGRDPERERERGREIERETDREREGEREREGGRERGRERRETDLAAQRGEAVLLL